MNAADAPDNTHEARPKVGWFTVFLIVSVLGLGALAGLLVRANNRLRESLTAAERSLAIERTRDSLGVGESVGSLTLIEASGKEHALAIPGERSTLVFLVSSHCPYCEQTVPVWDRILRQTESGMHANIAIVCVQADARSPGELRPLTETLRPMFARDHESSWLQRIPLSPGAVLIDRNGVVRKAWFGVPSDRDQESLAAALLGGV